MSLAEVLSLYMNLNLMLAMTYVGLWCAMSVARWMRIQISSRIELKVHYFLLSACLVLTCVHPLLPHHQIFQPPAKVWSASSLRNFDVSYTGVDRGGYLSWTNSSRTAVMSSDKITLALWIISMLLIVFGGAFIVNQLRVLYKIRSKSFLIKKIKTVHIFAHDNIQVPFSYWLPGQSNVVLPVGLLSHSINYKIALAHELQHHRQRDTVWVYILWGLRVMCVINPFVHVWSYWINEIQEFACDEALVDQQNVDSQAYARCLVEVAQTAVNQKMNPVCATGLTFLIERHLLNRRVNKMLSLKKSNKGRSISWVICMTLTSMMGITAFASKGLVQDRRVSLAQAEAWANKARETSQMPVTVNAPVLKQLNRFIGTPEGRKFMREALQRMENHKDLVASAIKKYRVPGEIMAIPIAESGYQNLPQNANPVAAGAGLWQFIPSTAKNYGLLVDEQKDERLDVVAETDAAMRYLLSNYLLLKDWSLAILGYNMGERAVLKAIESTGTRDAWKLIEHGHEGDKDYLAKVMASIIIMNNPESVN